MNIMKISLLFLCVLFFAHTQAMIPAAVPVMAAAKAFSTGGAVLVTKTVAGVTVGVTQATPLITTGATVAKTVISLPSLGAVVTAVGKAACGMIGFLAALKGAHILSQQKSSHAAHSLEVLVPATPVPLYPLVPISLPGREEGAHIIGDPIDTRTHIEEPLVPHVSLEFPPTVYEQLFFPPYMHHQIALWCIMLQTGFIDQYGNPITQEEYEELCQRELACFLDQISGDRSGKPQQKSILRVFTNDSDTDDDHQPLSWMIRLRTIPYHGLCRRPMQYPEGSRILDQLPIDRLIAQKDDASLQQIKKTLEGYRFPYRIVYPATKKKITQILKRINNALDHLAQEQKDRAQQLAERISNQAVLIEAHRQADIAYLQSKLTELKNSTTMCATAQQHAQLNYAIKLLQERINHPTTAALQKIKHAPDVATAHQAHQELVEAEKNKPSTYRHGGIIKRGSLELGFNVINAANTVLKQRLSELSSVVLVQPQPPLVTDQPFGIIVHTQPLPTRSGIELDPVLLDLVTTSPIQLPIDPVIDALIKSNLVAFTDKYQVDDPLLYAMALKNTLKRIHQTNQQISAEQLKEFRAKNSAEFHTWLKKQPNEWQRVLYEVQGFVEQLRDIKGFLHANAQLIELIIEAAIVGEDFDSELVRNLNPNSELSKFVRVINNTHKETLANVVTHIMQMNPEERHRAIGNIVGAHLQAKIITGAIPAALKTVEKISQVVAEGRVGQSVESFFQRATRIIGSVEEAIATTPEGISIEAGASIAAQQETVLAQEVNESICTGIKKVTAELATVEDEAQYICKQIDGRNFLEIKHPVLDNIRTKSALIKPDAHHVFNDIVDNFARYAQTFDLIGGDHVLRKLYQIEGSLNGVPGIFEWIVDPRPDHGVTHRFFIKNGIITGKPNIYKR